MWWVFGGFAAILYFALVVTLGVTTIRKGHWVMFILGIFLPFFWIIGALMPPTPAAAGVAAPNV
jgi:Na+-transporting NADH:ubiquinone oxidoreductase subunit NqrB